jgi:hypothetical protein
LERPYPDGDVLKENIYSDMLYQALTNNLDSGPTETGYNVKIYRLGVCLKCRGDLAYDQGDWICLQCGVYYYTGLYAEMTHRGGSQLRIAPVAPGNGASVRRASPAEAR